MGTGVISNKVVAIYLGPTGIALLGQLTSFINISSTIASSGTSVGVTKYIAEYNDNISNRKKVISTSFISTILITLVTSIVLFFGAPYFCLNILKDNAYVSVFYIFAVTLILLTLNGFLISVLNGFKEFKKIILINILSSFIGLVMSIILTVKYGVLGALFSSVLSVTLIVFITISFVYRSDWFFISDFIKHFDKKYLNKLLDYSTMTFVSVFAVLYIQLEIRTYLIEHFSIIEAGNWQGIIRISEMFLSVITTTLGIYYLPRLSEIKNNTDLRIEIIRGYKFLLPITITGSILLYLSKDLVIDLLFTKDFFSMKKLFFWQLMGNIFKIASWLIAFLMLAKAMTKTYIITEIIFGLLLYLLTIFFTNKMGLIGASLAYCINYFLYFVVMLYLFRKIIFPKLLK